MTYDPNRDFRDPNDMNELERNARNMDIQRGANASWGWLLGGVVAIVLILVALSYTRDDNQTASDTAPPATTTGQSSTPPSTTGQGSAPANRPAPAPSAPSGSGNQ